MDKRVTANVLIAITMRAEVGRRTASKSKRWKHLRGLRTVLVIRLEPRRRETSSQLRSRETAAEKQDVDRKALG